MISTKNLEKVLRTARQFGVSKIKFDKNNVSELEFFNEPPVIPKSISTQPKSNAAPVGIAWEQIEGMPTDEEFKYYHSNIVPAPDAIPQEEKRKAS